MYVRQGLEGPGTLCTKILSAHPIELDPTVGNKGSKLITVRFLKDHSPHMP